MSRVCSVADCDRSHHAKGLCKAHYGRARRRLAKHRRFIAGLAYVIDVLTLQAS